MQTRTTERMPAVFIGHGSPLNALLANDWTRAWRELGQQLPEPRAVLCISAHWYLPGTRVTAMEQPRTIHDFGGFPPELHRFDYPAPGAPALATRIQELLAPVVVNRDTAWGLDHGSWSVLTHLFPQANIPVVQLSIDSTLDAAAYLQLGRCLRPLRDEGVLILGSGGLVHNLALYARGGATVPSQDWAARAEQQLKSLLEQGALAELLEYPALGADVRQGIPTAEHFVPLFYVLGAASGTPRILCQGIEGGSISMLSVRYDG